MKDSPFIKKMKWLMKLAENATSYDKQDNTSSRGYAWGTLDHMYETMYEAEEEILQRIKDEEELDDEDEE